ncbi:MAG: hypothetical protein IKA67_03435 [Clostridia bacterium]|nr:hypothetical protein [Clostridia bacterium]
MKNTKFLILLLALAMVVTVFAGCSSIPCFKHFDLNGDTLCDLCGNPADGSKPCDAHVDNNGDNFCDICAKALVQNPDSGVCDNHVDEDSNDRCDKCSTLMYLFPACETHRDAGIDGYCDLCQRPYKTVTVAEALELCGEPGNITTERYYVRATVSSIKNGAYGEMYLVDKTGEIYVYGTYSHDGELKFPEIDDTPVKGDEVVLHCILQNYKGTKEIKNARLVGFKHNEADVSDFTEMSIADARDASDGANVIVEGIVAKITYANGKVKAGFILVSGGESIYVYGVDAAGAVEEGNKVKVAGTKDHWILDTETTNAEKYGYKGCNQLSDATVIENDKKINDYDKALFPEATVKEIIDTPASVDITTQVFKVTALVKKVPGAGFVNYYINDLDGTTGSYVYTQCNGADFDWLDKFDGKICTVYLTALNAKSNNAGCVWRFIPVAVVDEGYTFDLNNTAQFVIDYHTKGQFLDSYAWNPVVNPTFPLVTSVSSELLGFENATVSYASSDDSIITFITKDGVTSMKLVGFGEATVTITATYADKTATATLKITSTESSNIEALTVSDAIAASKGDTVVVKGIVGPSLVNKTGFYLIDESGVIAVTGPATIFEGLSIGNEVILKGTRDINVKSTTTAAIGQTYIADVEILANDYAIHEYSTASFVTDKTIVDIYGLDPLVDYSTTVFVTTATVTVEEATYYSNIYLTLDGVKLRLYSSSASQYNWLKTFAGQTVTVEVAACNWNDRSYYTGCVLSVVNADGTKTYNTLNFNQ